MKKLSLYFVLLIISGIVLGQNSVGIGTETPNSNAVLHLVSPTNNQGFLVTQLSTVDRQATAFTSSLADTDNGLLVYDSDLDQFFFWQTTQWLALGTIQDLQLIGNALSVTNNATAISIDLTPYLDNTDNQAASEVAVTASGNLIATDVQSAILELQGDIDAGAAGLTIVNSDATLVGDGTGGSVLGVADGAITDVKISDLDWGKIVNVPTGLSDGDDDNQDATEVAVSPAGNLVATDVQSALLELQGDIDGGSAGLTAVSTNPTLTGVGTSGDPLAVSVGTLVLDATQSTVTPIGNLNSTDAQAALVELQTDIDGSNSVISANTSNIGANGTTITNLATSKADLNAPVFTGIPLAPTASGATNNTQIATTAFVQGELAGVGSSVSVLQSEVDVTQTGSGLNPDGTYTANVGANFISSATSLAEADDALDGQIATNESDISTNFTNISANTSNIGANGTNISNLTASKADLNAPTFTGIPLAPTAAGATNNTQIATTAFVQGELASVGSSVSVLQSEVDVTQAGSGLNPDGTYTANGGAVFISAVGSLAAADDALDGQVATNQSGIAANVSTIGTNTSSIGTNGTNISNLTASKADLNAPTFTGIPLAPTAAGATNNTQIATTAFVQGELASVGSSVSGLQSEVDVTQAGSGLNPDGTYTANGGAVFISAVGSLAAADDALDGQVATNQSGIAANVSTIGTNTSSIGTNGTNISNLTASKADLNAPTFTGIPLAPTAAGATNNTQIATTAFVQGEISGISVNDADAVVGNEYNTSVNLNITALEVVDGGGTRSVDLDPVFATDAELSAGVAGGLQSANNLSDLSNTAIARTNLGLGTLATQNDVNSANIVDGTIVQADVANDAVTAQKINVDVAGAGLAQNGTTGALEVNVSSLAGPGITNNAGTFQTLTDNVTLSINGSSELEISPSGVTNTQLADNSVSSLKIANGAVDDVDLNKASIPLSGFAAAAATVDMGLNRISNLDGPVSASDAANRDYVDTQVAAASPWVPNAADIYFNTGNVGVGTNSPTGAKFQITPDAGSGSALRLNPALNDSQTGELQLMELGASGSDYVGFRAPTSLSASQIYTLPLLDGTNGQVLSTTGTGILFFTDTQIQTSASSTFVGGTAGNQGNFNVFVGEGAGQSAGGTDSENVMIGYRAGRNSSGGAIRNTFVGLEAGQNTVGVGNVLVGYQSGQFLTTANSNVLVGQSAGSALLTTGNNTFVGGAAGINAVGTSSTIMIGQQAGQNATGGNFGVMIGQRAGETNAGSNNVFIGLSTGDANTTGFSNTFLGGTAGSSNISGDNNTLLGYGADVVSSGLTNATAIGSNAIVGQSNAIVLGSSGTNVGIGTASPSKTLDVNGDVQMGGAVYSTVVNLTSGPYVIASNDHIIEFSGNTGGTMSLPALNGTTDTGRELIFIIRAGNGVWNIAKDGVDPNDLFIVNGGLNAGPIVMQNVLDDYIAITLRSVGNYWGLVSFIRKE